MHWVQEHGYKQRLEWLESAIFFDEIQLEASAAFSEEYIDPREALSKVMETIKPGTAWGKHGRRAYFSAKAVIPGEWKNERVVLLGKIGGTGLLYLNGEPYQGLDDAHAYVILADSASGGEEFDIIVEAVGAANAGEWKGAAVFNGLALARMNQPLWDLCCDARLALDMASLLPPIRPQAKPKVLPAAGHRRDFRENPRAEKLFAAVTKAFQQIDWNALGLVGTAPKRYFAEADSPLNPQVTPDRAARLAESAQRARRELAPVLSETGSPGRFRVVPVSHSHIDIAWKWPLRETVRKMARTTANILRLLERYPGANFTQSQAWLYNSLKDNYPTLYAQMKKMVEEGRWEILGGQWVECDTNLVSGESLIRQYLLGQSFFEREFGKRSRVAWLPDVFGLSPALPQVLDGCGIKGFFTAKQSSNDDTTFPRTIFRWEGQDGSRVTSCSSLITYNIPLNPEKILEAQHAFREMAVADATIMPFGRGDGGGGPTAEDFENADRIRDIDGLPRVESAKPVADFFDEIDNNLELPVWRGEIYHGAHRGTYTTAAHLKRLNRACELRLREAEALAVMADDSEAPFTEFWQTVCLMQFHDVLPGSSTDTVNRENIEILEICHARIIEQRDRLLNSLTENDEGRSVFNPHSWERMDIVPVEGTGENVQQTDREAIGLVQAEALMVSPIKLIEPPFKVKASDRSLENARFIIKLDNAGGIVSMWDKEIERELIPDGQRGNELRLHTDLPGPNCYGGGNDAWDISEFYRREFISIDSPARLIITESGPLRATIRVEREFGESSSMVQNISVYAHSDRIDFCTTVNWRENNRLMRVGFPVVVNAEQALCETAFGYAARPTHKNTTWDWYKFEVPCHRWVSVCDGGYGVALLNDSKYGYDVQGKQISLSLLRAPASPDPVIDRGEHRFTYSFMGHEGGPFEGGVIREAHALNAPLITLAGTSKDDKPFLYIEPDNLLIETVKQAEDARGFIVRVRECANSFTRGKLSGDFSRATVCNMLEDDIEAPVETNGALDLALNAFEVKTLRLE